MKALLSSLRTVDTIAPAAGTANTEASMQADSAAGANTPSLPSLGLSLDITECTQHNNIKPLNNAHDRNRKAIRFGRSFKHECANAASFADHIKLGTA